jgi:hypothetical protein
MQERFALRFESGERRGETIGIPTAGLSLGRRPGNSVQILDGSVSGKHAEIRVDAQGASLCDLGSTNGSFVGSERITGERRLAHRDVVQLGKVRFVFIDNHLDPVPETTGGIELEGDVPAASASAAGEGLQTISADKLARSGKRSVLVGLGLAVVVGAGGAAWWFFRSGGEQQGPRRAVAELAGNLIPAGFSFERELAGWDSREGAPTSFLLDASAASSGETGVRAVLAAGEWAELLSAEVRATPGKALRVEGWLGADGGAAAFVGIEFTQSAGALTPLVAWSDAATGALAVHSVACLVPPGFDRARAVVLARATTESGNAFADDVGLSAAGDVAAAPKIGEFVWHTLGEPARVGLLGKIDRPLLYDLRSTPDAGVLGALTAARVSASPIEDGFALEFAGTGARPFAFVVAPAVVAQGVATLGSGGLRTHQVEFVREAVDSLLFGAGLDLVRVRFSVPCKVTGTPEGGAFRFECALEADAKVELQVVFQKERLFADEAARRAREAEKQGRLGDCLAAWRELLDRAPFDAQLVKEAENVRARLIQQGLAEVQAAKQSAERARFFRLVDLFRQVRNGAQAIGAKYAKSEVEAAASALVADIERDLVGLEQDLDTAERGRLQAILAALEAQKMPHLAPRVRETLDGLPGGPAPKSPESGGQN